MDIEWQEGDVCFAAGTKWDSDNDFSGALNCKDFQINTIKQGDYIEASELDTENKYNDAVEVFGLFGFRFEYNAGRVTSFEYILMPSDKYLGVNAGGYIRSYQKNISSRARKITFNQLMAIGELKRLEIEREKSNNSEKPNSCKDATNKQEVKIQKNKPVVAQVMIDLTERMEIGIKTYGEALRANNGRDALQDAYEEALDLACYLKQAMIERDNENTN